MSNTKVYELARELGEEIKKSIEAADLEKARNEFVEDETAKKLFNEFYALREELQKLMSDPDITQEQADDIRERLLSKETELQMNPVAAKLILCESQFNNYVKSVFNILSATITGQDPNGCGGCGCSGGDCGSCGCEGCN
ncbi:MAG: YlbF family regulator [Firmicutes bacterium]|nr:YlbF family regulator [Bacillota bacterium]